MPALRAMPLVCALLLASCGGGRGEAARPNILLLSLDSVRRDHVSAYGRRSPRAPGLSTAPAFDALVEQGVLFSDAVSTTSWTLPAHAALLTGLPDRVHGVRTNADRIDTGLVTLAELLGDAGYRTGGFWSGPNLHPAFGFSQGFETYVNCSGIDVPLESFTDEEQAAALRPYHDASHAHVTSEALYAAATDWIDGVVGGGDAPFFAFVHWWDPHYDYLPPAAYAEMFDPDYEGRATGEQFIHPQRHWAGRDLEHVLALYDAEIRYTDDVVGRLLARLDELGVGDDTLVVYLSDHGDEFYEHGKKGHQRNLFEESVRVPLAMRWRRGLPSGVVARGQAGLQSVYPTIAQLLDLPVPAYVPTPSLAPLWEDPGHEGYPQPLDVVVPHKQIELSALRDGATKIVWDHRAGSGTVYDLRADPGEKRPRPIDSLEGDDLAAEHLRTTLRVLDEAHDALPLRDVGGASELGSAWLEELRRLGYL